MFYALSFPDSVVSYLYNENPFSSSIIHRAPIQDVVAR